MAVLTYKVELIGMHYFDRRKNAGIKRRSRGAPGSESKEDDCGFSVDGFAAYPP
jgi:hypothetical protein